MAGLSGIDSKKKGRKLGSALRAVIAHPWIFPLFKDFFWAKCLYIEALERKSRRQDVLRFLYEQLEASLEESSITEIGDASQKLNQERWYFFKEALRCLQSQDPKTINPLRAWHEKFLVLAMESASISHQGADASAAFVGFALWAFQEKAFYTAYILSLLALQSDPHWGYAHYLHAWLALICKGVDPRPNLIKAIQCDWSILHHIRNNPHFTQYPDLVESLKRSLLIQSKTKKSAA